MIGCLTFALASTIAGVPNKILGKTDILALIRCSLFFFFFKVYIYSFYSFLFFLSQGHHRREKGVERVTENK